MYKNLQSHLQELTSRFPKQFQLSKAISLGWPDGWHPLVRGVCEQVAVLAPDLYWIQIKEKFGGLRMYFPEGPLLADNVSTGEIIAKLGGDTPLAQAVSKIVDDAMSQSSHICAWCGSAGVRRREETWIVTACDACLIQFRRAGELNLDLDLDD